MKITWVEFETFKGERFWASGIHLQSILDNLYIATGLLPRHVAIRTLKVNQYE